MPVPVNGIHAAFTGRIGKDAEVRSTRDGKPWASFPVAVDAKARDGRQDASVEQQGVHAEHHGAPFNDPLRF